MLDVKRMRVLREIDARGSFSAAADALGYTQSAVSQQIAALEREAGVRLVERNARGVRLTDAGRVVVRHAEAILARLADAEAELDALAGLRGGRLRVASFPSAGATMRPRAIARFRERHPGVELSLQPAEPDEGVALLRSGEADLALILEATFAPACHDGVEGTHLLDDPLYLALPQSHPLADKPDLRLEELADESWIVSTSSSTCPDAAIFLRVCQTAGFEPRIVFQSDDYFAIQGFVAAGVGLSLIPDLVLVSVRDDIVIRSLGSQPPVRRIVAASLAESYSSPARQAMLDILVEVGAEMAGSRRELALAS
jgi:DNA-binding transcriptional LysR family regulator